MKPITLRCSPLHLATSRAVITCVVFVLALVPILLGLLWSAGNQQQQVVGNLFYLAALAPAMGILISILMLVIVLWRRSRPVLIVGEQIQLISTGVSFPLSQLAHLQLYSKLGQGTFLVLLPEHIPERIGKDSAAFLAAAPYTVRFPEGPKPKPFEMVELIGQRAPAISVDKLGTL
ncbi:hypothetical protein [Corynebacterium alimapuense]|uniref:DUF304 domain-containing protein n=1 Tax=Corynebacterium alimapuense TaxID=1576874 RepID=A0A3M8K8Z2_9CORY|nr:hypothetical protein [Corynebacterium alimapuense]RNE49606.1 hypothetical protein C5L39_04490 [Corynebacterium alimapuense]